ncbi:MAG: hypothetical protein FWE67_07160 [Planctomycetaceae bacterium]|nr:hypothetical protein [Planctomycetaceae bacterium]
MLETEVTQAMWESVMGNNPSFFEGCKRLPVETVSWDDCQEFIEKINGLAVGYTICTVMRGSGAAIGMVIIYEPVMSITGLTQWEPIPARTVCFAAAVGPAMQGFAGRRFGSTTHRGFRTPI